MVPFIVLAVHGRMLPPIGLFLACFALAFSTYLYAVWRGRRLHGGRLVVTIVGVGLACRLLAVLPAVGLSDDIYRYLWEGRLGRAGINPYTHSPDDPRLDGLDDPLRSRVSHREVAAVYPPLAQLAFRGMAHLGAGTLGWRLLMVAVDGLTLLLLIRLLRRMHLPEGHLLIHAWNPLVIIELAGSGHIDGLALPFLVVTAGLVLAGRPARSAISLALAALAKLHVAAVLPYLVTRRRGVLTLLLFGAIVAAAYLPYREEGMFQGLRAYGENWSFNSPAYDGARGLADILRDGFIRLAENLLTGLRGIAYGVDPEFLARALLAVVFFGVLIIISTRRIDLVRGLLAVMAAFLLLSPTIHPWYLLWLMPFLVLRPDGPLLLLTGTVALTYLTVARFQTEGIWTEASWVRWVEFGPVIGWMVWRAARRRWRLSPSGEARNPMPVGSVAGGREGGAGSGSGHA